MSAVGSQGLWSADHPEEGGAKHFVGCLEMSGSCEGRRGGLERRKRRGEDREEGEGGG